MATAALPKLDGTFGAMFIGVTVGSVLWGVAAVQMWFYFSHYPNDWWCYKWLVTGVFVSDTIHQILITHCVYTYLVTFFGDFVELGNIVWSLILEVLFNGITALLVQSFMVMRVWGLTGKSWRWQTTGLTAALVLAEFIAIFIYTVRGLRMTTFVELTTLKELSMAVNVIAATGDVLIAIVLCFMLQKSRTGFRNSDTIINALMLFTMNTGLLTSMCAVASLISIVAAPKTFIYIAFYFNIGRLYSNSLLATLNARNSIRAATSDTMTVSLHNIRSQGSASAPQTSKRSSTMLALKVDSDAANVSEADLTIDTKIKQDADESV